MTYFKKKRFKMLYYCIILLKLSFLIIKYIHSKFPFASKNLILFSRR